MKIGKNIRDILRYSDPIMLEFALGVVITNLAFTHPGFHTPVSTLLVCSVGLLQLTAVIIRCKRSRRAFANILVATIYLYLIIRHTNNNDTYSIMPYIYGGLFSIWCL